MSYVYFLRRGQRLSTPEVLCNLVDRPIFLGPQYNHLLGSTRLSLHPSEIALRSTRMYYYFVDLRRLHPTHLLPAIAHCYFLSQGIEHMSRVLLPLVRPGTFKCTARDVVLIAYVYTNFWDHFLAR